MPPLIHAGMYCPVVWQGIANARDGANGSRGASATLSLTLLDFWSGLPFVVQMPGIAPPCGFSIICRAMDGAPDPLQSIPTAYPLLCQVVASSRRLPRNHLSGKRRREPSAQAHACLSGHAG